MKYAAGMGADFVVIVGDEEVERGKALVRDMKDGSQREVAFDPEALPDLLKSVPAGAFRGHTPLPLRPVMLRRTQKYAFAPHASGRLVIHRNSPGRTVLHCAILAINSFLLTIGGSVPPRLSLKTTAERMNPVAHSPSLRIVLENTAENGGKQWAGTPE